MHREGCFNSAALTSVFFVALVALLPGCGYIPIENLRQLARALPAQQPINEDDVEELARQIRNETGVEHFSFSETDYSTDHNLPFFTQHILSVAVGKSEESGE